MQTGYSDALKQRSEHAHQVRQQAAERLESKRRIRKAAGAALEETYAQLEKAKLAYATAQHADTTAEEVYSKAKMDLEESEKAVSEIDEEVKINLLEAEKLLKLFS